MTLQQLLQDLADAVKRRERERALTLARQVQQHLAADAADRAAIERQLRALLAELSIGPGPVRQNAFDFDPRAERGDSGTALAPGDRLYPVWFGTNRRPIVGGKGFGSERNGQTILGRVDVRIPEAHRFGEIGSSFWTKLKRFDFADDTLRVHDLSILDAAVFWDGLRAAAAAGESHALFYLHGYNVSFEGAAIRAAQLGCDLAVPGPTAFFSWPSRGTLSGYTADEASIEASERAITDFLVAFATKSGAQNVHVIAHSMGNRGLLRALQRIAANAETQGKVKFGQIFLAAPDVDRDLFLDLAHLYPQHSARTTLYASNADLPVELSSHLHDAPRAGYFAPYTVATGVDTIAVPDFNIDFLGHSYYAQAEALLHDIHVLIRRDDPPDKRQRLTRSEDNGLPFWKLRR